MPVNKIISLTKVFIKEYYQNLPIFDTSKKKLNKKSVFYWLIVIIFFGVSYVSYETLKFLGDIGQKELFINFYLPIMAMVLAFQSILACANIFFFSKDIENVLHMPIKPHELAIAKLGTLLCMLYFTEGIATIVPLIMYGMMSVVSFTYYFWMLILIILYPIFIATLISILTFIIMRFSKFVRNKEIFQIIMTVLLISTIFVLETVTINQVFTINTSEQALGQMIDLKDRMQNVNKAFLIVNPSIQLLTEPAKLTSIISFVKIIAICIAEFIIFMAISKLTYIKDILKNAVSIGKINKKVNTNKITKKIKKNNIAKTYILKELKTLIRNPNFFMQCIFPVISLLISSIIIVLGVYPVVIKVMEDEQLKQAIENLTFNTEVVCDILIILQVFYSISNISLTAISREGKDAIFIKYMPVEFYKQFKYKAFPQFVLNLLITITILGLIWYVVPSISVINMTLIFVISIFINLINSYLMLVVDLLRPNLDWKTEEAVVRKSDNKLFQYAFLIINVLVLLYIATVLKQINILYALIIEIVIYGVLFIGIDRCIKKFQKRLFSKII